MMPLVAFALVGCLAANPASDHIAAADLAPQFPAMSTLPPDIVVAIAPAPGVTRIFRLPELRTIASRFHLAAAPESEICVVRPVSALDPARLLRAMQASLPAARIDILDFSRQGAPQGEIEFPTAGLRRIQEDGMWTGYVRYAGNRRFVIWAKVKIAVLVARVIASADLPVGIPIEAGQVTAVTREEFPHTEAFPAQVEDVIGKVPRAAIRAGAVLRADQLDRPREVLRGDTVLVEVKDGAASLKLEATAEASGALGDLISLENPVSHKRFRGRVEGPGRVSVNAAPRANLKVYP